MAIYKYIELQDKLANLVKEDQLYRTICKNIKEMRKIRYNEFKEMKLDNSINPYTTENFADLLNYDHTHYKRFESETDSTKRIPLIKIIMASLILDVSIELLLKEQNK